MRSTALRCLLGLAFVGVASLSPTHADGFCGFYVAPSDKPLYNDATMVALMRDGTRTVISMSNNYKGPAGDFAMVVPVPVVLQKENVKTLRKEVFTHLEELSAPRLVEYWEQDPCAPPMAEASAMLRMAPGAPSTAGKGSGGGGYGVTIEAKFSVGEYDILILGAKESDGLEAWLRDNKYNIPAGASEALAPYVKEGQKFFVAKVDSTKVQMDAQGVAVLSPLRFNYESPDFRLPVRLGLLNAQGKQDLIVYVLSNGKRFEVANYPNVTIPTNLDVADKTREAFAPFYAALFDRTVDKAGGEAIVTEYSWQTTSCDPCPTPPLGDSDVATLGGDVLFGMGAPPPPLEPPPSIAPTAPAKGIARSPAGGAMPSQFGSGGMGRGGLGGYYGPGSSMILTRLHARYDKTTLTDDLVFREAPAIQGGREMMAPSSDGSPDLEKGAQPAAINNFQARYVIRHAWEGAVKCDHPVHGVWGAKPGTYGQPPPVAATGLAAAPRGKVELVDYVKKGLDGLVATAPRASTPHAHGPSIDDLPSPAKRACACEIPQRDEGVGMGAAAVVGLVFAIAARRSRRL